MTHGTFEMSVIFGSQEPYFLTVKLRIKAASEPHTISRRRVRRQQLSSEEPSMDIILSAVLLVLFLALASAQKVCDVPGICDGNVAGLGYAESRDGCMVQCRENGVRF